MAEIKLKEVREQLRAMSEEELHNEIAVQRRSLYTLRRKNAMRQLENTSSIRVARKQIARVLTLLKEREIAAKGETK